MSKSDSEMSMVDVNGMLPTRKELLVRTSNVSNAVLSSLGLEASSATCAELNAGSELYGLVCAHICEASRSFTLDIGSSQSRNRRKCDSDDEDDDPTRCATKDLGLGIFTFEHEGASIHALHQTLGEVVGTDCGATLLRNLVLISPDGIDILIRYCDQLIAKADASSDSRFSIFRWHAQYQYWRKAEVVTARSVDSVVLPKELKSKIVDDLDDFLGKQTKQWYVSHGVPYKRSFLLHGEPGAGKTSLIQALAGRFKRNVCYLSSLSHPDMNDDNLKNAVQRVPARSLIVLEDVDALFDLDGRRKKDGDKSALTFSGVLNALDGVGGSSGQIFILTTNHRERLDPALIRNGRVDVHIRFSDATHEQMQMLFAQYYPEAPAALGTRYADALTALLGERTVSMASLQHYFIQMRKESAETAASEVRLVLEEADQRKEESAKVDKSTTKDKAKDDVKEEVKAKSTEKARGKGSRAAPKSKSSGDAKDDDSSSTDTDEEPAARKSKSKGSKEVHIHVH